MAWDDAKKQKAIELYKKANPTAETSMEVVKEVAEELGETANGVRMILSKAEVYIKKEGSAAKKSDGEAKVTTRVSKEEAISSLKSAIEGAGFAVEDDIVDKLTGKAAQYFSGIVKNLSKD